MLARYTQKPSGANEEALEYLRQEVTSAERRVADAEERFDATSAQTPTDAMLDAFNAIKAALDEGPAPINERLRRVFKEFRLARLDDGAISVLPVLAPDAIEQHGRTASDEITGTSTPTLLLVSPPMRGVQIEQKQGYAWA
jgi:hypothetical protein